MSSFFGLLSTFLWCGTLLGLAFMVVLALPQSKMRDVMKQVLIAVACAIYVISPIDLMPEAVLGPFGLLDDGGALIAGILSARNAWRTAAAVRGCSRHRFTQGHLTAEHSRPTNR